MVIRIFRGYQKNRPELTARWLCFVLRTIRPCADWVEADVHHAIAEILDRRRIPYEREATLGPGSRIDFLVGGGIGIEAKHGKPHCAAVARQLERYAASDRIAELILVTQRGLIVRPTQAAGKPIHYVALTKNWGIAT